MRAVFRSLILCCVFSAVLPIGCKRAEPLVENESSNLPRLRELDFAPFEKALAAIGKRRLAAVDRLVRKGDVASVGAAMAKGDVSSEELTVFFLDRIGQLDGNLRSYLELNPRALDEARAMDKLRAAGTNLGPLHGIPVNLKDNIGTTSPMHTTVGAEILLDHSPAADAVLVKKLRAAGAVIL